MFLQPFNGIVILAGQHLVQKALHPAEVGIAVLVEEFLCHGNLSDIGFGRKRRFRCLYYGFRRFFPVGRPVYPLSGKLPEVCTLCVGHLSYPLQHSIQGCILPYLALDEGIEHERKQSAKGDDHIQLRIYGKAQTVGRIPAEHHKKVHGDDGKGGADMGIAQLYKQVVKMGLVRTEGRLAPKDAGAHHPERVKDGYTKDGKGKGHNAHSLRYARRAGRGAEAGGDEHGEDYAQRKRAGIADEHLGRLAVHVVQEERNQGGRHHGGERDHASVAQQIEHKAEKDTADYAVAGRVTVHAVYEVDRIDDAHTGEHGKRDGNIRGDDPQTPQAVEVADADVGGHDKVEHKDDLYDKPYLGGKRYHVVHQTHYQDDDDAGEDGEKVEEVAEEVETHHSREDAEHDRQSAEHGNGHTLELARVGVVHDVLYLGHLKDIGENPGGAEKRNKRW